MPVTLPVGSTATAVLHEFSGLNGTGSEVPPIGPVNYSTSDSTIATVDISSGLVTAVASGTSGSATATITGTDTGNGLQASDTVTVMETAPAAQSATLVITPSVGRRK